MIYLSRQKSTQMFMDVMTITARNIAKDRWVQEALDNYFTLARIKFK